MTASEDVAVSLEGSRATAVDQKAAPGDKLPGWDHTDGSGVVRIADDGGVTKTVLELGDAGAACPKPLDVANVIIVHTSIGGEPVLYNDDPHEEVEIRLGRSETARGLEMALATMRPGERSRVVCSSDYGFTKHNCPTSVQYGDVCGKLIEFDVRLLRSEADKNFWDLTDKEKFDLATRMHRIGNQQYNNGQVKTSLRSYDKAVKAIEAITSRRAEVDSSTSQPLLFLCLNNSSACHIRLKSWDAAIRSCTQALGIDNSNVKCLYRRGIAYGNREEYELALRDLKKAQSIEPSAATQDAIKRIKAAQMKADKKAR
ncbi:hypothetical protein PBRA_004571 [Plasmodiophora brassicae]|nr:hypothetical protein PBRA_004571 [Plasmodiophora brassicae]